MLAQLEKPTNDFFALARYLVEGRERPPNPNRVAWTMAHNLPTDDPLLAAQYMTATAEQSKRCKNACYHTIIAWAKDEQPSPEVMQEIARRTLEMADLGEHQALIMGHGDKEHPHLHMMINRVHPVTGKAWSTSHDYRRFDRIMAALSEEYRFQYVPAHAFNPELTEELPKKPGSGATYAAKKGADTNRLQWRRASSRKLGERLSDKLDLASSWDDVEAVIAGEGLALQVKGDGLAVGDAASYAKFSALGLATSAKGLERRFGRRFAPRACPSPSSVSRSRRRGRNFWDVDAVDIARAIGDRDDIRQAVQDARIERKARLARAPLMKQLMEELKESLKASTSLQPPKSRPRPRPSPRKAGPPSLRSGR